MSGLMFHQQKQTKHFKRQKTHKNIGHLKIGSWPHNTSPSLQPIVSWNFKGSHISKDHCVRTVSFQSKNSGPQTTITKFNINKGNWHLFTSNEAWNKVTNPNRSQSAEALTEDFYIKIPFFLKICYTSDRIIKKHFPKSLWSSQLQKLWDL